MCSQAAPHNSSSCHLHIHITFAFTYIHSETQTTCERFMLFYLITRVRAIEGTNNGLQPITVGSPVSITKLEHLYPDKKKQKLIFFCSYTNGGLKSTIKYFLNKPMAHPNSPPDQSVRVSGVDSSKNQRSSCKSCSSFSSNF